MNYQNYEEIWEKSIKPKIIRMLASDNNIIFIEGQVKEFWHADFAPHRLPHQFYSGGE
jgi:hypothetical protein